MTRSYLKQLALPLIVLALVCTSASAQTLVQRCIGVVPGQEPKRVLGEAPDTMQWCRQLPGSAPYDQAKQRYEAHDNVGAAHLLEQAAQAGNPLAQEQLALWYGGQPNVPHPLGSNPVEFLRWARAAAAQHMPLAEDLLGSIYEYGKAGSTSVYDGRSGFAQFGVADDWDTAAKLWQDSATQGWQNGEFSMGRAYEYGIGVPLSLQNAIAWYDKAASHGHAQAAYMAKYLRDNHGFDGTSRDDAERAMLGALMGRTAPFIPPAGTTFHHLSERLAFVRGEFQNQEKAKAEANRAMRDRRYKECKDAGGDSCIY